MKNLLLILTLALLFFNLACKKNSGNPVNQNPTTSIAPIAPTLSTPANNSIGIGLPPTLIWYDSYGATSYSLQVFLDSNFTGSGYNKSGLTGTSLEIPSLTNKTKYYWHVRASNSYGTSQYSSVWNFTTAGGSLP